LYTRSCINVTDIHVLGSNVKTLINWSSCTGK